MEGIRGFKVFVAVSAYMGVVTEYNGQIGEIEDVAVSAYMGVVTAVL